jgi:HAD-superfamily hydrolase, subfamily IIIA
MQHHDTAKLMILDKDGTLVEPASGAKFVRGPEDQRLLPGVAEALERCRREGWTMAIASNQGGVQAGYKSLDKTNEEMFVAMRLTGINRAVYCPDSGLTACQCRIISDLSTEVSRKARRFIASDDPWPSFRKPHPGMITLLLQVYKPQEVVFVGDRPEDMQAAIAAGVRFQWATDWLGGAIAA